MGEMTKDPSMMPLVIAGPTASGKSQLALRIAEKLHGEIICCDSVAVYQGCSIGAASPSEYERERIPHHLIGFVSPDVQYHAAQFVADASIALKEIISRGRVPIIVGGTTLYLSALLNGLSVLPSRDLLFRSACDAQPIEVLYQRLYSLDPVYASTIAARDRMRITRALEILSQGHDSMRDALRKSAGEVSLPRALIINLYLEPELLRERIRIRVDNMFTQGLVDEVRGVLERFGSDAPPLKAVGYREVVEMLHGTLDESSARERIAYATNQLAKRQRTFWRNEPRKRGWAVYPRPQDVSSTIRHVPDTMVHKRSGLVQRGSSVFVRSVSECISLVEAQLPEMIKGDEPVRVCQVVVS